MLNLTDCTITCDDAALNWDRLEHARVTQNGPRATILVRDGSRFRQKDRLTSVNVTEVGDGWVMQGISAYLRDTVRVPEDEAAVSIHIVSKGGCTTC